MTLSLSPSQSTDGDRRWKLWVDGCGGFLVLIDDEVSVGREASDNRADVGLIADVPRLAGKICRDHDDYYWQAEGADSPSSSNSIERHWIESGNKIGDLGSAKLRLRKTSALCNSAVLTLDPPHRLGGHIDAVLLVNQTWLIGPSDDCHVRCRSLSSPIVVTRRDEKWWIKQGFSGESEELPVGRQISMGSQNMRDSVIGNEADSEVTMLLEPVANR